MKRKVYGTLLIFMLTMSSGMAPLAAETEK